MMAIIATRIMNLTHHVKCESSVQIHDHFSEIELKLLGVFVPKCQIRTLKDAAIAVATLGGYLSRKGDGPPGVVTMWRGMSKLADACAVFLKIHATYG